MRSRLTSREMWKQFNEGRDLWQVAVLAYSPVLPNTTWLLGPGGRQAFKQTEARVRRYAYPPVQCRRGRAC